eukprot:276049_1
MGNELGNDAKKHGVKDGSVFDEKVAESLGRKNVPLPKFIKENHAAPSGMKLEKVTVPYEPDKNKFCILIHNAFTKKECKELIKLSEKQKYGPAYVRTRDNKGQQLNLEGRNNSRVMIDSHEMANFFFKRVEEYVPKKWNNKKVITFNERLRFLRYYKGEYFKLHLDGPYQRDNGERSWCTIVIYLNENFKGGSTMLWDLQNYDNNKPVIPEIGMVLCFQHDIWHEGEELIKGTKYIIRTDVMYEANECKEDENKIEVKDEKQNET